MCVSSFKKKKKAKCNSQGKLNLNEKIDENN